jgi:hypothetical protein
MDTADYLPLLYCCLRDHNIRRLHRWRHVHHLFKEKYYIIHIKTTPRGSTSTYNIFLAVPLFLYKTKERLHDFLRGWVSVFLPGCDSSYLLAFHAHIIEQKRFQFKSFKIIYSDL